MVVFWSQFATESKSAAVSCKEEAPGMCVWTSGPPKPCFPIQRVWF